MSPRASSAVMRRRGRHLRGCECQKCAPVDPLRRSNYNPVDRSEVCPWCGPYERVQSMYDPSCPVCGLDAGEVAYAERIMALGGAEVYRQEYRAAQKMRKAG